MKMNAGVWIGIIGGGLGFLVGIIAVLQIPGSTGFYIAGGMILFLSFFVLLFYKLFFGPMILSSRLQKTGLPGKALIKEVRDTGVTINYNPQVKLILEVKDNIGKIYMAEVKTIVSRIMPGIYQVGMTIPVKIDPNNEKNVAIDTENSGSTSTYKQAQSSVLENEIKDDQAKGEIIRATGTSARAIIKTCRALGANVNGNNPYTEMEIEILPMAEPSFTGKVRGVISEQSVSKFQPGKEIFVKYDPADHNNIAIDCS